MRAAPAGETAGGRLVSPKHVIPLNLPNALTMLRILAVPVVVVALLSEIGPAAT